MPKNKEMSPDEKTAQKRLLDELMRVIGKNLSECRTAKGFTQSYVAERLDISIPFLSNMERGKKLMSVPMLLKLADLYGVDTNRLLYAEQSDKRERLSSILLLLQSIPDTHISRIEKHLRIEVEDINLREDADK